MSGRKTQPIVLVRDGRGPAATSAVKLEDDVVIALRMLALLSSIRGTNEDESEIVARLVRAEAEREAAALGAMSK